MSECPECGRENNLRAVWFVFPFWFCRWCSGSYGAFAWFMSVFIPQHTTVKMVSYPAGPGPRYFIAVWAWFTQKPGTDIER